MVVRCTWRAPSDGEHDDGRSDVQHPAGNPQMRSGQVAAGSEAATLTATASKARGQTDAQHFQARTRLDAARSMPEVLSVSGQAFEQLLAIIREHEEHAGGLFAEFVLAAASAADGRDALIAAPSLRLPLPAALARPTVDTGGTADQASDSPRLVGIDDIAGALADLSQLIAATLARAASHALVQPTRPPAPRPPGARRPCGYCWRGSGHEQPGCLRGLHPRRRPAPRPGIRRTGKRAGVSGRAYPRPGNDMRPEAICSRDQPVRRRSHAHVHAGA